MCTCLYRLLALLVAALLFNIENLLTLIFIIPLGIPIISLSL
jgi:hypothetical protein